MTAEQELSKRFYDGLILWIALVIVSLTIIVLSLIFRKRIIAYDNSVNPPRSGIASKGLYVYIIIAIIAVGCAFFTYKLIPYFQDLSAIKTGNYEVFAGEVIEYTKVNYSTESGITYKNPKIKDSEGKTIVLNLKYRTTETNKSYKFLYLKHTKLAVTNGTNGDGGDLLNN